MRNEAILTHTQLLPLVDSEGVCLWKQGWIIGLVNELIDAGS